MRAFALIVGLLAAGLGRFRPDAVIVYSPPLPVALAAVLIARSKRIPVIVNVQDIVPQCLIELGVLRKNPVLLRVLEMMEKYVNSKADILTVHSEGNRQAIGLKGVTLSKLKVVPNWADLDAVSPGPKFNPFSIKYGLEDKFVASFAGVMGTSQDMRVIIEAARILQNVPKLLFLLVGDGVQKGDVLKWSAGLNNVMLLPPVSREVYPSVLHSSDVSLATLKSGVAPAVVPSKILNIMASGRPVVAAMSMGGEVARILESADCGHVVGPGNPHALASVIENLYQSPEECLRLGSNGRRYAEQHFSRHGALKGYLDILDSLGCQA